MTREQRLELLKQIEKDIHVCSLESTFLDDAKSCAIHSAIEELEQEPKTGRWIPCSERLPEEGERVLATHLGGLNPERQVIEHIYSCGKFILGWEMDMDVDSPTFGQDYMGEVIAWMPLPEPYREDGEKV